MLKLATLLQNPGEPEVSTQYKRPAVLKELGYNGLVLYSTTGLSGVSSPDEIPDRELARWVGQQIDEAARRVDEAVEAGLDSRIEWFGALPQTDVLASLRQSDLFVLPSRILEDGDRDGLPKNIFDRIHGLPLFTGTSCSSRFSYSGHKKTQPRFRAVRHHDEW